MAACEARFRILSIFALCFVLVGATGQAESPAEGEGSQFTRLTRSEDSTPTALEAAIVRYSPSKGEADGPIVDLVAAVHVAEGSYFEELNRRFEKYDVVLYELVAPKGTKIPKGGVRRSSSAISMLQTTMTDVLELEFQLNGVDYSAENFVHADMTPEEFSDSMRDRGETMFKTFFRMLRHTMSQQAQGASAGSDWRLLFALFSKDRAMAMKRVLAEEFQNMEGTLTAINGPDGSTLITERNKVALEALREQITAGHKRLAIFYGAGHMSDFETRLREDFSLVPTATTWLVAWDLQGESEAETADSGDEAAEEGTSEQ